MVEIKIVHRLDLYSNRSALYPRLANGGIHSEDISCVSYSYLTARVFFYKMFIQNLSMYNMDKLMPFV